MLGGAAVGPSQSGHSHTPGTSLRGIHYARVSLSFDGRNVHQDTSALRPPAARHVDRHRFRHRLADGGAPAAQQKQEYLALLDAAVEMKLNAIVSEVRPTADAFWPSPYEPWSQYITGEQGRDPEVPQV